MGIIALKIVSRDGRNGALQVGEDVGREAGVTSGSKDQLKTTTRASGQNGDGLTDEEGLETVTGAGGEVRPVWEGSCWRRCVVGGGG